MKSQKKITIKPFLNQNLIPECTDGKGKDYYPLYLQVTYDRKNTQLRSKYGMYYETLNDAGLAKLIAFETKVLTKIIEFETSQSEGEYDLKGLKNKYTIYSTSVHYAVDEYLRMKLQKANKRTNNELIFVLKYEGFKVDFNKLYEASKLILPNLAEKISAEFEEEIEAFTWMNKLHPMSNSEYSFATLIDWQDNSFKSKLEQSLNMEFKGNKKRVAATLKTLDNIVTERLKELKTV